MEHFASKCIFIENTYSNLAQKTKICYSSKCPNIPYTTNISKHFFLWIIMCAIYNSCPKKAKYLQKAFLSKGNHGSNFIISYTKLLVPPFLWNTLSQPLFHIKFCILPFYFFLCVHLSRVLFFYNPNKNLSMRIVAAKQH